LSSRRASSGRARCQTAGSHDETRSCGTQPAYTSLTAEADARHLAWLRSALGDRFLAGAVLHTGPGLFQLADRIAAIPICAIWG
jgi:hypothetical protein